MNKNKNVWFYILGLLSGMLFIPVIEEFINVIMSWIQVLILKPTEKVLKGNKELENIKNQKNINRLIALVFKFLVMMNTIVMRTMSNRTHCFAQCVFLVENKE